MNPTVSLVDQLLFGIYPYIALAVFFLGSLARFEREQYTWKADSSQLLRPGQLRLGSHLFHIGILGLFFGHLFGLLTPLAVWHALGVEAGAKQLLAILAGGFFGVMCLAGMVLLLHRRLSDPRVRAAGRPMDVVVMLLLLAQLLLGLATIPLSWAHLDGGEMLRFMAWSQHIWTLRGGAAALVADAHPIFKAHLVLGLTVFLVFPFTRLVHVWSGFAALTYLFRPYQLVRRR